MIDPKLLTKFDDAGIARVKAAIANANPRTIDILEKLDQPTRLQFLLADSERERAGIHRAYWKDKFADTAKNIGIAAGVPLAVLGALAVYPNAPASTTETAALLAVSAALGGVAGAVHQASGWVGAKIASAIEKRAARYAPSAVIFPVEAPTAVLSERELSNFASLAGRMRNASPKEREIFGIVGRIVSASVSANINGSDPHSNKQVDRLQDLRTKLDEMAASDPMGARECERRLTDSLGAYGMSVPPSQKQEASIPQRSRGLALGA